ncbi:unnamed protein product [Paramecium sonneborni]|uniref:Uncharacterized protein n=1 Tax=Paramecium sonneborni TaxID=65129 RepID=A0A8S1PH87_9CILI|nr:unnamed protein product [Paramecium sonneborni]
MGQSHFDGILDGTESFSKIRIPETRELEGIIWNYYWNPPLPIRTKYQVNQTKKKSSTLKTEQFLGAIREQIPFQDHKCWRTQNKLNIQNGQEYMDQIIRNKVLGQLCGMESQYQELVESTKIMEKKKDVGRIYLKIIGLKLKSMRQDITKMILEKGLGSINLKIKILEDYNQNGLKCGKWIELLIGFRKYAKVTYNGEYNIEGRKIGKWDILYSLDREKTWFQIGGGTYSDNNYGHVIIIKIQKL